MRSILAASLLSGLIVMTIILLPTSQAATNGTLTVTSDNESLKQIKGYLITLEDASGNALASGYTPVTFSVTIGQHYMVSAQSYLGCTFDHWYSYGATGTLSIKIVSSSGHISPVYDCLSPNPMTEVIPLYQYPDAQWIQVAADAINDSGRMIAVIDPSASGIGSFDQNYANYISVLQKTGVSVYGYIPTVWGNFSNSVITEQMREYKSWYGVSGIFLDQMASTGLQAYYQALTTYAHSLGLVTMGNPGEPTSCAESGTVDNVVIYEGPEVPNLSSIASEICGYPASHFTVIAHDSITLPTSSYIRNLSEYASNVYVTNNAYSSLATYFDQESKLLAVNA